MNNKNNKKLKIDLGCGSNKRPGFVGVDKSPEVKPDIVCDFEKDPLPFENDSVTHVWMNHVLEHIDDLISFFEELYRVCENGAIIEIVSPYYSSIYATRDPTHKHFISEGTFLYFTNKEYIDPSVDFKFKIKHIKYNFAHKIFAFLNKIKRISQKYIPNSVESIHVTLITEK